MSALSTYSERARFAAGRKFQIFQMACEWARLHPPSALDEISQPPENYAGRSGERVICHCVVVVVEHD
jgi:hypothetical protein